MLPRQIKNSLFWIADSAIYQLLPGGASLARAYTSRHKYPYNSQNYHFISPVFTLALSSSELSSASPGQRCFIALITPAESL